MQKKDTQKKVMLKKDIMKKVVNFGQLLFMIIKEKMKMIYHSMQVIVLLY